VYVHRAELVCRNEVNVNETVCVWVGGWGVRACTCKCVWVCKCVCALVRTCLCLCVACLCYICI
jgi:hypothetical protein